MAWRSTGVLQKNFFINIRAEIKKKSEKIQITKIRNESGHITKEIIEIGLEEIPWTTVCKKKKKLGNLKEMDRLSETQTTKPD